MAQGTYESGIYRRGDVRLSDLAGRKALPIGVSDFRTVLKNYVFVDKSLLIADVLATPGASLLFCRPRRFGKSLNLSMLQAFFETTIPSIPGVTDTTELFQGLAIWDAEDGRYREHHGAYPVVRLSFGNTKGNEWNETLESIQANIAAEYERHNYLAVSDVLSERDQELFLQVASRNTSQGVWSRSLLTLCELLHKHHKTQVVVLIDEYDAPVMAGYTYGYYDEVVAFLKRWLTGALKDNSALAVGVLTGVQRISKESIFSDLNNLIVSTSLSVASDERYGFTQMEIDTLAFYRNQTDGIAEARSWYDGYRFGNVDVYNPWSALNYFNSQCTADVYWGNTSRNDILTSLVHDTDDKTMSELYTLMQPDGTLDKAIDTSIVFPDLGIRPEAVWSMLYLAGYLTTNDTKLPNNISLSRVLRIPNREVAHLFRSDIIERFSSIAGDRERLGQLHRALTECKDDVVAKELECILKDNASYHDLYHEAPYHTLLLGLLFGMSGYEDPMSNREAGHGRFDVRVQPISPDRDPLITIEAKWAAPKSSEATNLPALAQAALAQIEQQVYESSAFIGAAGTVRWGVAFSGKHVICKSERVAR
ncbi:AAA family ATPase [Adlercreutzia sp. ZJ141]|uniref:AAA family ATPase n=1 Tax=Adlercreutzia sp. ZJ141 TaxID=2709406 RepID=UPI0013ED9D89|nr:AAA family ATPase [Adlercreutzia sp. ZJ141]